MSQKADILNGEQVALVTELTETYGIKPEDIIFFQNDKDPFLSYEATCRLSNRLLELVDIDIEPVPSVSTDSLSLKCSLIFENGHARRAVGVVNYSEQQDGAKLTDSQTYQLASARAIRNALKNADVDLIALHRQAMNPEILPFKVKTNYDSLLKQAHALGVEAMLIDGENKRAWYFQLASRYNVYHSNELTEEQLADFVAFLRTMVKQPQKMAA